MLRLKSFTEIIEWLDYEPNMIQERLLPMTDLLKCIDEILRTEVNCDGKEYLFYKQVGKNILVQNEEKRAIIYTNGFVYQTHPGCIIYTIYYSSNVFL